MKVSGKFLGSFNKTSILIQEPRAHARVVIGGGGWRALETVVLLELTMYLWSIGRVYFVMEEYSEIIMGWRRAETPHLGSRQAADVKPVRVSQGLQDIIDGCSLLQVLPA